MRPAAHLRQREHNSLTRRSLASLISIASLSASPAGAFLDGLFESPQQKALDEIISYVPRVVDIQTQLQKGKLKDEEDSLFVLRYSKKYFNDLADLLEALSPSLGLEGEKQSQASALPKQIRSQLKELTAACKKQDFKQQEALVTGVSNSLREFLELASSKYTIKKDTINGRINNWDQGDNFDTGAYFGVFSCEGVGLKRKTGSNTCVDP